MRKIPFSSMSPEAKDTCNVPPHNARIMNTFSPADSRLDYLELALTADEARRNVQTERDVSPEQQRRQALERMAGARLVMECDGRRRAIAKDLERQD